MENQECPNCKRPYGERRRCYTCTARPGTGEKEPCRSCGKPVYRAAWQKREGERIYCSRKCQYDAMRGRRQHNPLRNIGSKRIRPDGYVEIKIAHGKRWVLEHRFVVESALNRKLSRREEVHHINGDRADNRPENLRVYDSSEHQKLHEHWKEWTKSPVRLNCKLCSKQYKVKPSRAKGSSFCSNACKLKAAWESRRHNAAKRREENL